MALHIHMPRKWDGFLIVADVRQKADRDLDLEEGGEHVLEYWPYRKALSKVQWERTARVTLFDHGERLSPMADLSGMALREEKARLTDKRARARQDLRDWLSKHKPKSILCLQSRSISARNSEGLKLEGDVLGLDGTICWDVFEAPGSLAACAGTTFASKFGPVLACPNPVNNEYVFGELVRRWVKRAAECEPISVPDNECLSSFHTGIVRGWPLAVDIETFMDGSTMTAIGLANGFTSISVPWDAYQPHGIVKPEPGCTPRQRALVQFALESKCPKVLHNGVAFDIPYLQSRGLTINGPIHDTMIMHGLVYPQYRHGLQFATAQSVACPPWKTAHLQHKKQGDPRTWQADPHELRTYNRLDAWYTLALHERLSKWIPL